MPAQNAESKNAEYWLCGANQKILTGDSPVFGTFVMDGLQRNEQLPRSCEQYERDFLRRLTGFPHSKLELEPELPKS